MQALANKTIVSMHAKPEEGLSLTDEVLYGMPVEILKIIDQNGKEIDLEDINSFTLEKKNPYQNAWCYIRTHYRYEGYVRMADLYLCEDETYYRNDKLRTVMQAYADVLSEPRVQGVCLQSITRGGRVCQLEQVPEKEGWVKVSLVDGTEGYTKEKFLGPTYFEAFTNQEEIFRNHVVETAKLYLGTQYRWGGKSPLGIDCSGLTSMCYMLCGVNIYRDASIEEGFPVKEIEFANKKPGDLLYFPGHIAMYMGDDYYIHSTGKNGSDGVVINSFDASNSLYREDLPKLLKAIGSIF